MAQGLHEAILEAYTFDDVLLTCPVLSGNLPPTRNRHLRPANHAGPSRLTNPDHPPPAMDTVTESRNWSKFAMAQARWVGVISPHFRSPKDSRARWRQVPRNMNPRQWWSIR